MSEILDLKGRFALVTGAGRGVGFQIASQFAKHNVGGIVINDFYQERAEAAANELEADGAKCKPLPISADITKLEDVQRMVATAEQQFGGPIQILVNNAGGAGVSTGSAGRGRFADVEPTHWDIFLKPNLYGVMNCSHSVVKGMIATQYGKIVTVISDAGRAAQDTDTRAVAGQIGQARFLRPDFFGEDGVTNARSRFSVGQIAGIVHEVKSVREVIAEMVTGCDRLTIQLGEDNVVYGRFRP